VNSKKIIPVSIAFYLAELLFVIFFIGEINLLSVYALGSLPKIPVEFGQRRALEAAYNTLKAPSMNDRLYTLGGSPVYDLFVNYTAPHYIKNKLIRLDFPNQNLFDMLRLASLSTGPGSVALFLQTAQVYYREFEHQVIIGWLKTGNVRITMLVSPDADFFYENRKPWAQLAQSQYDSLKQFKSLNPIIHVFNCLINYPMLETEEFLYVFLGHLKWNIKNRRGPWWTPEDTKRHIENHVKDVNIHFQNSRLGNLELIKKIIDIYLSKNIEVFIVELPTGTIYNAAFSNLRKSFIMDMNSLSLRPGVHFIEWKDGPVDDSYFYDSLHLNLNGSKIMNLWLTETLGSVRENFRTE